MDIRVEASDGCQLPTDSFLAVKLGDVLKQGRYEPTRTYQFPKAEKRRHAKIDIFKHVGSAAVLVCPDAGPSINEVSISSRDPVLADLRMKVDMTPQSGKKGVPIDKLSKKVVRSAAQTYLDTHKIEEKLSACVKQLLKAQPEDPIDFICCHLRGTPYPCPDKDEVAASKPPWVVGGPPLVPPPKEESNVVASQLPVLSDIGTGGSDPDPRMHLRQALAQASFDGSLLKMLGQSSSQVADQLPTSASHEPSKTQRGLPHWVHGNSTTLFLKDLYSQFEQPSKPAVSKPAPPAVGIPLASSDVTSKSSVLEVCQPSEPQPRPMQEQSPELGRAQPVKTEAAHIQLTKTKADPVLQAASGAKMAIAWKELFDQFPQPRAVAALAAVDGQKSPPVALANSMQSPEATVVRPHTQSPPSEALTKPVARIASTKTMAGLEPWVCREKGALAWKDLFGQFQQPRPAAFAEQQTMMAPPKEEKEAPCAQAAVGSGSWRVKPSVGTWMHSTRARKKRN